MGDFTQNLLKLTEFPFSYSLMGLLALIFGQGINPQELSFAKLGPLLILMGFVATTLSICDPVGALQRKRLRGDLTDISWLKPNAKNLFYLTIWGKQIGSSIDPSESIFPPPPYLYAIAYSPEGIKKESKFKINWDLIKLRSYDTREFSASEDDEMIREKLDDGTMKWFDTFYTSLVTELDKLGGRHIMELLGLLAGVKDQSVKTKWITAEIDRISALIYFMIIICLFIAAVLVVPSFLPKFAQSFGYEQPANLGIWAYFQPINLGILTFSGVALAGVVYMLRIRFNGLESKALTVFKYLIALGAIRTAKEKFKPTLDEIEDYLNENHWTLAEYWVNRIQADYSDLFLEEVESKNYHIGWND